jgi:hypothetical protein
MKARAFALIAVAALTVQAQSRYVPAPPKRNSIVGKYRAPSAKGTTTPKTYVLATDQVFPHLAVGDGWETILVLVNMSATSVNFTQEFYDPSGNPMAVTFRSVPDNELVTTSAAEGTLTPESSFNILLFDGGPPLKTGWSFIDYTSSAARLGGYVIFRNRIQGVTDFEAFVPLSAKDDYRFYFPFDNLEGFVTSMAILNPASDLAAHVTLAFLDPDGNWLGTEALTLAPGQQMAFSVPERFPVTQDRVGTVYVESDTDRLSGLGFRFNPKGAFATIPILNWIDMF